MRTIRRLSPSIVLALALSTASAPAPAFDQPGCGGSWSGSKNCRFLFEGFPITYRGDAIATNTARVRVWITVEGYPEVVLFSCEAQAKDLASCSGGFPDETTVLETPQQVPRVRLRCFVEGAREGEYFCGSGT